MVLVHLGRIRNLEAYSASSLISIEKEFKTNPPKGIDSYTSMPSAYVIIEGIYLRRAPEDDFDDENPKDMFLLDSALKVPFFEIRDITTTRVAAWGAGNSKDYLAAKTQMNFDSPTNTLVRKIVLQYRHNEDRGLLAIRGFGKDNTFNGKRLGFRDRLKSLIDGVPLLYPAPTPKPI